MTDELPVVILEGLEGSEQVHLKGVQIHMAPFVDDIFIFWWGVFCLTLAIVIIRMLLQKRKEKTT